MHVLPFIELDVTKSSAVTVVPAKRSNLDCEVCIFVQTWAQKIRVRRPTFL